MRAPLEVDVWINSRADDAASIPRNQPLLDSDCLSSWTVRISISALRDDLANPQRLRTILVGRCSFLPLRVVDGIVKPDSLPRPHLAVLRNDSSRLRLAGRVAAAKGWSFIAFVAEMRSSFINTFGERMKRVGLVLHGSQRNPVSRQGDASLVPLDY